MEIKWISGLRRKCVSKYLRVQVVSGSILI